MSGLQRLVLSLLHNLCEGDDEDDISERAIIEYEVHSLEKKYIFELSLCSSNPPEMGEEIPVLYDPNKPSKAMDASFASAWLFQVIFGVGGLLLSIGSCFHLRSMNDDVDELCGQGESQHPFGGIGLIIFLLQVLSWHQTH